MRTAVCTSSSRKICQNYRKLSSFCNTVHSHVCSDRSIVTQLSQQPRYIKEFSRPFQLRCDTRSCTRKQNDVAHHEGESGAVLRKSTVEAESDRKNAWLPNRAQGSPRQRAKMSCDWFITAPPLSLLQSGLGAWGFSSVLPGDRVPGSDFSGPDVGAMCLEACNAGQDNGTITRPQSYLSRLVDIHSILHLVDINTFLPLSKLLFFNSRSTLIPQA